MEILLLIFIHTLLSALFPVSPDLTEALLGKDKVNGVRPSLFRNDCMEEMDDKEMVRMRTKKKKLEEMVWMNLVSHTLTSLYIYM
ncbi:unnamed protein product [Brassica oleracea]